MNSGGLSLSSSTEQSTVAVPDRGRAPLSRACTAEPGGSVCFTSESEVMLLLSVQPPPRSRGRVQHLIRRGSNRCHIEYRTSGFGKSHNHLEKNGQRSKAMTPENGCSVRG
ncbi:hypothetical protein EYF80_000329 [Liparis tanakae]|uniref:Uncharacterized protein n=1 Tax=Liparis tanakae TaxID=230148 RepID=A0A4Z2JHE5_9TELE|nr:hypothetical protein EYF80_000329 [Liparis tanakae]